MQVAFVVEPEPTPPPVFHGSNPSNGASNVSPNVTPSANFDTALSETDSNATLICDATSIDGDSSIFLNNVLVFTPTDPLPYGATCTANYTAVGASGGSTQVQVSFVVEDA